MIRLPNIKKNDDYLRLADGSLDGYNRDLDGKHRDLIASGNLTYDKIWHDLFAGTLAWTPANIPASDQIAWYDASDASTITESGGSVSNWDDKWAGALHLAQGSGSLQPSWGSASINGLNVVEYAATLSYIERIAIPDIDCTQIAIVTVGMGKTAGDFPNMGRVQNTAVTDRLLTRLQSNPTDGRLNGNVALDGVVTTMQSPNSTDLREEIPFIVTHYYDGAEAKFHINGNLDYTVDPADGATLTVNEIRLGRDSNTPQNYQGEVIYMKTTDPAEIQNAEGYLAWKWSGVL